MIELVRHALLLCCVSLDVDDIADTVGNQECREFNRAMVYHKESFSKHFLYQKAQSECICTFEASLEHMARTRPVTEGVRHFEY